MWYKKGGELPAGKTKLENFNKALRISNVSEEDSGEYFCLASNKMGSIRHTISVRVKGTSLLPHHLLHFHSQKLRGEHGISGGHLLQFAPCVTVPFVFLKAAPYWLDEPQNLILAPGEDGRLVCRANGNPKPSIQWLVNGEPIEGEPGRVCTSYMKT